MNVYEAKQIIKPILVVTAVILGLCGFCGGIWWGTTHEQQVAQQRFCAPDKLDHSFLFNHETRAICYKSDNTIFISDKK